MIFRRIVDLVARGEILVSGHGYDEMASDDILVSDVLQSLNSATVAEEYPDYFKGPCVLALHHDRVNQPLHVLWGIPRHSNGTAVIVTAYRPDPNRWDSDFKRRKS